MKYLIFYSFLLISCFSIAQNTQVKDIDGNVYDTVKIGRQVWLMENLKTAHFRDGTPIPEMEDNALWQNASASGIAAWCYYDTSLAYTYLTGKLYNWYAVADPRHLCPVGWHVPSDDEFKVLSAFLGGDTVAGGKMKNKDLPLELDETAQVRWTLPNILADHSSGFRAVPGGRRSINGPFSKLETNAYFWSSTQFNNNNFAFMRILDYSNAVLDNYSYNQGNGYSVRCLED